MKRRVSTIVNFIAFNLLFFALYLNFVHKDANTISTSVPSKSTVSANRTVLVENPEQYLKKTNTTKGNQQIAKVSYN